MSTEKFQTNPFDHLKEQVALAIGQSCETSDGAAAKVVAFVSSRAYKGVEPGVDLVDSLNDLVRGTIQEAVRLGCDLKPITKGLVLGTFRARGFVRLEAHKVITHLVGLVVTDVADAGGDVGRAVAGFMEGIAQSAPEMKLNKEEALFEAANAVLAKATEAGPKFLEAVRQKLKGHNI